MKYSQLCSKAILAAMALVCASSGYGQEAPFGLAWGPIDKIPKPASANREANITTLFYDESSSFVSESKSARVILEVCRAEGLQQVITVSPRLPPDELSSLLKKAHDQGVSRFGESKLLNAPMTEVWNDGRVYLGVSKGLPGQQRIVMRIRGEQYEKCSAEHYAEVGHLLDLHFDNLVMRAY